MKRLLCFIFVGGFLGLLVGWGQGDEQGIRYNHKVHVKDVGLDCISCHANVQTNAKASIPNIEICSTCHNDVSTDNAEIKKVAEFVTNKKNIPWKQIHQVPDHAYFSHRRHIVLGKIDCASCHGNVAEMEKPFVKPFITIKMDWCRDCHKSRGVTNDCYACHR